MKQKFLFLLLTALFGMFEVNAWAQDYEITCAQDLFDFAEAVNNGELEANAVLTDDIDMSGYMEDEWTAIGDWHGSSSAGYKGHFDGQGHTIKNFNFTATHNYFALFGVIWGSALVENFTIEGDITVDGGYQYAAGVAAYTNNTPTIRNVHSKVNINSTSTVSTPRLGGVVGGCPAKSSTTTIDRCTYSGTLNANDKGGNYGGIVGYINNNSTTKANITNCLFDGKLQGTGSPQLGGLIGYTRAGIVAVNNCLSVGTIEYVESNESNVGQFAGRITYDSGNTGITFTNNYYVDNGYLVAGSSSGGQGKGTAPVVVTAAQLESGDIAFKLNEEVSGGTNWYQTLIDEEYPTPNGSDKIYANGSFNCDMTPKEGLSVTYGNTNSSIIDPHDFADGFCTVCGTLDETWMAANGDGFFEIGTAAQLKWFAVYVNTKDVAANAKLTADIDMTGVEWTPMGIGSGNNAPGATAYTGTFDGQGHSITGFSAEGAGHLGLFGDAKGATIKNFSISGTLNVTDGYGGGVVAWPANTTIENVHSALVVSVPNSGTHHVGGVVGSARGGNTISGCSFSGSMTVAAGSTDNFAGIAAYITNGDNVINCANYGDVTFSDAGCAAGGIVGYVNAQQAAIQNCLSTGQVIFDVEGTPTYGAAVIGRTKGFSTDYVKNNYWLEGTAYGTIHNNNGTEAMETGSITAEQLASGEVAYKLGAAWSQLIETDKVPVLGGDTPVSYVGEVGYATLYDATTGYELNGDVTANVATLNTTTGQLTLKEIENIPAGTPVVLKGGYYNKTATDLPAINIANDLKGTDVDTEADGTMYVLAKVDDVIGFYKATGTIPAGKAYYQSTSGVKAFFFAEDDATGIDAIENGELTIDNASIYNVAGQKLSKLQKGINIVNGKKVAIK